MNLSTSAEILSSVWKQKEEKAVKLGRDKTWKLTIQTQSTKFHLQPNQVQREQTKCKWIVKKRGKLWARLTQRGQALIYRSYWIEGKSSKWSKLSNKANLKGSFWLNIALTKSHVKWWGAKRRYWRTQFLFCWTTTKTNLGSLMKITNSKSYWLCILIPSLKKRVRKTYLKQNSLVITWKVLIFWRMD